MSEKLATPEKVKDAIAHLRKLGVKVSAERVRGLTGGSKSAVLPLYKHAVEKGMMNVESGDENRELSPPQELQEAVQKACKAISAIPAKFMDELGRYDRIIGYHSNEVLVRETAERDERISQLQEDLEAARRGAQDALSRIGALEEELAAAKKYMSALETGIDLRQALRIARDQGAAASQPAAMGGSPRVVPGRDQGGAYSLVAG